MENKNNNILSDDELRALLQGSKLKASENLQHRIMHQIMTEEALKRKKVKSTKPIFKSIANVAIVFYVLIIILSGISYYLWGIDAIVRKEFLLAAGGISMGCIIYGSMIIFDERRYLK